MIRVGPSVARELLALSAAAGRVPVPRVLGRLEDAILLERVPRRAAAEVAMEHPSRAGAIGRACAALHDALAAVDAPPGLRAAAAGGPRRLLHLDLHPFNVVVDGAGAPTGTIDWANAAAGRWAYEFMLADLSGRYPEAELAPIRPPTDRTG